MKEATGIAQAEGLEEEQSPEQREAIAGVREAVGRFKSMIRDLAERDGLKPGKPMPRNLEIANERLEDAEFRLVRHIVGSRPS